MSQVTSSTASRITVSTNSDENSPIAIRPPHAMRSPQGGCTDERPSIPSGIRMHDRIRAMVAAAAPALLSSASGISRAPT
ncbi:hypothetical protein G6F59_016319 [Rhizopus arrhizus]|nr:hypothetical protein G6F59_016319 [Rhizopus arrhizus]